VIENDHAQWRSKGRGGGSDVAIVPCALGQKLFLRPHQQNCRV